MDKYGIQEQIKLLQNAKTAREISERAGYFTLIIKENEALKREYNRQYELCYKEAELTPDCKPYYCVKKLKAENKALKEQLEKAEAKLFMTVRNNIVGEAVGDTDVIALMIIRNFDGMIDFEKAIKSKAEAEARLKELKKGEKE